MCTFVVHCSKIEFLLSSTSALKHFELSLLLLCEFSLLLDKWRSGELLTILALFILLIQLYWNA